MHRRTGANDIWYGEQCTASWLHVYLFVWIYTTVQTQHSHPSLKGMIKRKIWNNIVLNIMRAGRIGLYIFWYV